MPVTHSISIEKLHKVYKIYPSSVDRVKEIFHPFRKKYFKPFHVLSDISMTVNKGDTVGIIGRNGSGKSTLLQIICGILTPTSGKVEVVGRIAALLELGAGFNPEFTGRENVFLNGSILGISRKEMEQCFDDILAFADIGEFIDQPVKTYSSGMYVRLAFAVAINVQPDILIVDEALSVGDTLFQAKCFAKFKEFQRKGITILFVTHSVDLITRYCNVACLLEQGKVQVFDEPQVVIDQYNKLMLNRSCAVYRHLQDESGERGTVLARREIKEGFLGEQFCLNPDENRYGNHKAVIEQVGIYTIDGQPAQALLQMEEYEIRCRIRFNEAIVEPIVAYSIKDVHGLDISGTNTLYHQIETGPMKAGDVIIVSFVQPIPFAGGGYLLSCGCAGYEGGEYVVYERRYEVLAFEVAAVRPCVGLVDLNSKITLSREGNVFAANS